MGSLLAGGESVWTADAQSGVLLHADVADWLPYHNHRGDRTF